MEFSPKSLLLLTFLVLCLVQFTVGLRVASESAEDERECDPYYEVCGFFDFLIKLPQMILGVIVAPFVFIFMMITDGEGFD